MSDGPINSLEPWLPGSFTKNFGWGRANGLKALYDNIRVGFAETLSPVERDTYRSRVQAAGMKDFIPINFFLFNSIKDGVSVIEVDELVFQAITATHSRRFDLLALFAFNFSHAGTWKRQTKGQRYPAAWATSYIVSKLNDEYSWDVNEISVEDIEDYLRSTPRFKAATSFHKIATNLSFMYEAGGLREFIKPRIERWWVDSLFLALDRIIADRDIDGTSTSPEQYPAQLLKRRFLQLTGPVTPERTFAISHLIGLYSICGGINRFVPERVQELISVEIPNYSFQLPNDTRPQGALHPTNPRILKTIPRECADLAKSAGFDIVLADDLEDFDPVDFINRRSSNAIAQLDSDGIRPVMTAEELHKLTRG